MADEVLKLGPWQRGLDNRSREDRLSPAALREAANLDLDPYGIPRRRKGYTLRASRTGGHSLASVGGLLLQQTGGALVVTDLGGYADTSLVSGLNPRLEVSYCEFADAILWTNGEQSGRIRNGLAGPWGIPTPNPPNAAPAGGGNLPAGQYLVAVSFEMADGTEGGASTARQVTVSANGVIVFTGLPGWQHAYRRNLYASKPNGAVLYYVGSTGYGASSFTFNAQAWHETRSPDYLDPMPPGQICRAYAGHVFVASGAGLYWCEPGNYHLCRMVENFQLFSDAITVLEPSDDGLWVVAGRRTYWMGGVPGNWTLRQVAALGASAGAVRVDTADLGIGEYSGRVSVWKADTGIVAGLPSGQLRRLTDPLVAMDRYENAALLFREEDGLTQILAAMRNPSQASAMTTGDYPSCSIVRNGVVV